MKRLELKELFAAFLIMLTVLFLIGLSVFILDVRGGASINRFNWIVRMANAGETSEYFALDENTLVEWDEEDGYLSIVDYKPSEFPLKFACGTFQKTGFSVSNPYQKGSLVYNNYYDPESVSFTDEDLRFRVLDTQTNEMWDDLKAQDLAALGLDPSKDPLLTLEEVQKNYPRLSVQKESCVDMSLAFILLYMVLIPPYLFFAWKARQKN